MSAGSTVSSSAILACGPSHESRDRLKPRPRTADAQGSGYSLSVLERPGRRSDAQEVRVRALVVDDSRAIRSIIGRILSESGFEVTEATHGGEALECLRSAGPFDLAMVDWNMPEMNGYELVSAVRANPDWASMRIVMVTTETEMAQVSRALEAGADEYVMKPFTREILHAKLELLGLSMG